MSSFPTNLGFVLTALQMIEGTLHTHIAGVSPVIEGHLIVDVTSTYMETSRPMLMLCPQTLDRWSFEIQSIC